jgi:hypothetical protein
MALRGARWHCLRKLRLNARCCPDMKRCGLALGVYAAPDLADVGS